MAQELADFSPVKRLQWLASCVQKPAVARPGRQSYVAGSLAAFREKKRTGQSQSNDAIPRPRGFIHVFSSESYIGLLSEYMSLKS
jgi:hypothetical protein